MEPPKNLKLLLFDRFGESAVRDQLIKRIAAPEDFERVEANVFGPIARVRYATAGGFGDSVYASMVYNGNYTIVGATHVKEPIEGPSIAAGITNEDISRYERFDHMLPGV